MPPFKLEVADGSDSSFKKPFLSNETIRDIEDTWAYVAADSIRNADLFINHIIFNQDGRIVMGVNVANSPTPTPAGVPVAGG